MKKSAFNWDSYIKKNPLLRESREGGDYISDEEFDYMDDSELDAAEAAGDLNPSNESEIGESNADDKATRVGAAYLNILEAMREEIKFGELDEDDVEALRDKLADFFKRTV